MGKVMSFEDSSGTVHESSYWLPVAIEINKLNKSAMVRFAGYHNQESRNLRKYPIGTKIYYAQGETFDALYSTDAVDKDPYRASYTLAENTLEGIPDTENRKSFFDGATDV